MEKNDSASNQQVPGKSARNQRTKIIFLIITAVAVLLVYRMQRTNPELKGWGKDLNAALAAASAEGRPLLVFFDSNPPSATGRNLTATTFLMNEKAIENGKFIKAAVSVDTGLKSDLAKRYQLRALPTTMILGPDGVEKNRREGKIGEVPFRNGFLDCTQVEGPEASSK
jgi:hypothetical protein